MADKYEILIKQDNLKFDLVEKLIAREKTRKLRTFSEMKLTKLNSILLTRLELNYAIKACELIEEMRSQKTRGMPDFQIAELQTENELYEHLGMKVPYYLK